MVVLVLMKGYLLMGEKKVPKRFKNITTGISLAATIFPLIEPTINLIHGQINKIAEEKRQLVDVPELYSKGFPLTVDQASKLLNELGFKYEIIQLPLIAANTKYRNCFDHQVVETHPKAKQKVKPGSNILIKYITQEVIDESKRMFESESQQKEEQKTKAKQTINGVIKATKNGVQKIPNIFIKKSKEDTDE